MKAILARLASHKTIGAYVTDQEVTLSLVAATPLGLFEVERCRETCTPQDLPQVLARLLGPTVPGNGFGGVPLVLGVPADKVYFSTRPIRTDDATASPQVLLREALQSPTLNVEDMVVDVVKSQPGYRKVASLAACRKKYLMPLLASLAGRRGRLVRVEPGPCALLRAAYLRCPPPRKSRALLRIFLGDGQGLAVALAGNVPLLWRCFHLAPGEEAEALRCVLRSLQAVIVHCGIEHPVDAVLVHGRPDLHAGLQEGLGEGLGVRLQWLDGPALDAASMAYGLALGGLRAQAGHASQRESFDLADSLKPPPGLRQLFPWKELALQVALLAALALFLLYRTAGLEHDYQTARASGPGLGAGPHGPDPRVEAQLRKEQQERRQRVEAAQRFLATRLAWTSYTAEVSRLLPPGATLLALQGRCELNDRGGKATVAMKSLLLRASVPITAEGTVPPEVDAFLAALRASPLFQRDFPLVSLADIRWLQTGKDRPLATFTVLCLPADTPTKAASRSKP